MNRVVTMVGRLPFGGIEKLLLDLIPLLVPKGFASEVVCVGSEEGAMAPLYREAGIAVHHLRVRSRVGPLSIRRLAGWLAKRAPALVHAHGYAANVSGALAAGRAGVPVILGHLHNVGKLDRPHRIRSELRAEKRRSLTLAVSAAVRDDYLATTGVAPERVRVLHNGRKVDAFLEAEPDPGVRTALGIPAGARLVGMAARLVPQKRPQDFVKVAARVVASRKDVHFLLAGDGSEMDSLRAMVHEQGLEEHVTLAGHRNDVPQILSQLDLFLLPSAKEGLPLAVIEAFASGLPVVCTDVGGNAEILRDGVNGHLAEVGEIDVMAARIDELLSDESRRQAMAREARETAREFTIERMADRLTGLYQQLLATADALAGPRTAV